jgi:hypothetical protein
MMRAAKKPKLQVERFIQPSSTPAVKLIWEYAFANGRTTLQTGHVSLGEATLESEPSGSLYKPHAIQDWPDYNDWDEVSPFCDPLIITGDVLQDKRKEYAAVSEKINDIYYAHNYFRTIRFLFGSSTANFSLTKPYFWRVVVMKASAQSAAVAVKLKIPSTDAGTVSAWKCTVDIALLNAINPVHCMLLKYVFPTRYMVYSTNLQT